MAGNVKLIPLLAQRTGGVKERGVTPSARSFSCARPDRLISQLRAAARSAQSQAKRIVNDGRQGHVSSTTTAIVQVFLPRRGQST